MHAVPSSCRRIAAKSQLLQHFKVNKLIQMEPIHLRDGERVETFKTLPEAVEAAKNWYRDLASYKLPPWDYEIRDFNGLSDRSRTTRGGSLKH